jgi:hypothetical protein
VDAFFGHAAPLLSENAEYEIVWVPRGGVYRASNDTRTLARPHGAAGTGFGSRPSGYIVRAVTRCDGSLEKPCGKVRNFTIDPSIAGLVLDSLQRSVPDG